MNRPLARMPQILLLASTFFVSPFTIAPAASAPAPVKLGEIKGESTEDRHKDLMAARPLSCAAVEAGPVKVASDPEEGGQVARTAKRKPTVGDISVMKTSDKASTKLAEAAPSGAAACAPVQH